MTDDKGAPVADAYVRIYLMDDERGILRLRTDAAGKASGDNEPYPGSDMLGQAFVRKEGFAADGFPLRTGEKTIRLQLPAALRGRIVDEEGKALPGVGVSLSGVFGKFLRSSGVSSHSADFFLMPEERDLFQTRTDAEGRYQLHGLPPQGTALVSVRDELWESVSDRTEIGSGRPAGDIKTRPGGSVSGRVFQPDGKPLADGWLSAGSSEARTDGEGRFHIAGIAAGDSTLKLSDDLAKNHGFAPPVKFTAIPGKDTVLPDIHLSPGVPIELNLTVPLSSGRFTLSGRTPENPAYIGGLKPKNGVIQTRVLPGTYLLNAERLKGWRKDDTWPIDGLPIEVKAEGPNLFTVPLAKSFVLEGTVREADGGMLTGLDLTVSGTGEKSTTDANGHFRFDDVQQSLVSITAPVGWKMAKNLFNVKTEGTTNITLTRVPLAPLHGRVVDERGNPLANTNVQVQWILWTGDGGGTPQYANGTTDDAGRYQIADVPSDLPLEITATKSRFRYLRGGKATINSTILAVTGAAIPNPNAAYTVSDIVLQDLSQMITGRVVDAAGKPVAGAFVGGLGGGRPETGVSRKDIARTDSQGRYRLTDLPQGELTVVAGSADAFGQIREVPDSSANAVADGSDDDNAATLPDIVLAPIPEPRQDAAGAKALITQALQGPHSAFGATSSLISVLGPYDFTGAVESLRTISRQDVKPETLRSCFTLFARNNPQAARDLLPQWLPELEKQPDSRFASFVISIARMLAQNEQAVRKQDTPMEAALRLWVHSKFEELQTAAGKIDSAKSADLDDAYSLAYLAALAGVLGDARAGAWVDNALAIAVRYDTANPVRQDNIILPQAPDLVKLLVPAGVELVERGLADLPPEHRAEALAATIPPLAGTDMAAARRLLATVPDQATPKDAATASYPLNYRPDYAFGMAAKGILARMTRADAADALTLARQVTSEHHIPEALALAARLQPDAEATGLFREAFEYARNHPGNGSRSRIISLALSTRLPIGAELLKKFEESSLSGRDGSWGLSGNVQEVAFLTSRLARGEARAMLEWLAAQAGDGPPGNDFEDVNRGFSLGLVTTMLAADIDRAKALAPLIPPRTARDGVDSYFDRTEAQRRIAQYMMAPAAIRNSLDFDRWSGYDTWLPQEDGGW